MWETKIEEFREDPRIAEVLLRLSSPQFQPDMSISVELKGLLAFASKHSKDRWIRGPEDLGTAEQILNEINLYRDRSVEVYLDCLAAKSHIDRALSLVRQVLFLQPEVQKLTESGKNAVAGNVGREIEDLEALWDILLKQAEAVTKNCRAAYDNLHLQVEVAKQIWFQRPRVDEIATPRQPARPAARQAPDVADTTDAPTGAGGSDEPYVGVSAPYSARAGSRTAKLNRT